jgi:hypothetical protein
VPSTAFTGPGANKLTISGGGNFTDFILESPTPPSSPASPSFVPNSANISGITIADGNASYNGYGNGGGILSFDALTISNCVLKDNQAPGGSGAGGAIYSSGGVNASLILNNDTFTKYSVGFASETNPADFEMGGAIFDADGPATLSSCAFTGNNASGANAQGGAIQAGSLSTVTITGSTFTNNSAIGSISSAGGAIASDQGLLAVTGSTFTGDQAKGSSGAKSVGASASGGAIWASFSIASIQGGFLSRA